MTIESPWHGRLTGIEIAVIAEHLYSIPRIEWSLFALTDEIGEIETLASARADEVARHLLDQPRDTDRVSRAWLVAALRTMPKQPPSLEPAAARPLRFGVPAIANSAELATMLNLTAAELEWFADDRQWLRRPAAPQSGGPMPEGHAATTEHDGPLSGSDGTRPLRHYREWAIPKRVGIRVLEAPKPRLREIQRTINRQILAHIPPHPAAHAFRPGRSARSFAQPHQGQPAIVRVDLRHCFSTVTVARVRAIFESVGYSAPVARALANLCTTATPIDRLGQFPGLDAEQRMLLRVRHLPQGAPTSPALLNLVLRRADIRIDAYAQHNGLQYTRYCDDLALSGVGLDGPRDLWVIGQITHDEGFRVHPGKSRVIGSQHRQTLAGLVVNARPQVPRHEYDDLRALLHNAARTGPEAQNRDGIENFRDYVQGRIAWVSTGNPTRAARLRELAADVTRDR